MLPPPNLPFPPPPNPRSASTHARDVHTSRSALGRTRAKRCVRRGRTQALLRKDHTEAVYSVVCAKSVLEPMGGVESRAEVTEEGLALRRRDVVHVHELLHDAQRVGVEYMSLSWPNGSGFRKPRVSRAGELQHTCHPVEQSRSVTGGGSVARGIFFCRRSFRGWNMWINGEKVEKNVPRMEL